MVIIGEINKSKTHHTVVDMADVIECNVEPFDIEQAKFEAKCKRARFNYLTIAMVETMRTVSGS